eukprot:gene10042-11113_t
MDIEGDLCCVHVRVKCSTLAGQSVGISGSSSAFQSADFPAVPLVTTPESYPIWHSQHPIVLPRRMQVTYNYCIIEGGKIKAQEQALTPRVLVPEEAALVVEDEVAVDRLVGPLTNTSADILEHSEGLKTHTSEGDFDWMTGPNENHRLFLVCYHLPVEIKRTDNPEQPFLVNWSESLIAKTEGSIAQNLKTTWIGTVPLNTDDLTAEERDVLLHILQQMNCVPVFLEADLAADAYYGFCKTVMWPVFHNVDQLDQIHAAWNLPPDYYESHRGHLPPHSVAPASALTSGLGGGGGGGSHVWDPPSQTNNENKVLEWNKHVSTYKKAYCEVNRIFSETIIENTKEGDFVWVHDYHLMLVPSLLRNSESFESRPVKILFFLHIPFPTSQIFRTLPEASQLLQSMNCADLVGFHAFDHARHFLNASRRMLGHRYYPRPGGMITISVQDRDVLVTMSHVSIETARVDAALNSPEVALRAEKLRERFRGKKVVLGIDVCQRLSGLALKMAAFEKYLTDSGTTERAGVVLVQRAVRQGSRPEDEETTSSDVRKMVTHINAKYSLTSSVAQALLSNRSGSSQGPAQPVPDGHDVEEASVDVVDYEEVESYKGLNLKERLALYLVADVFLLSPLREGLNLLPLEYIYARKDLPRGGVVITSEFSTCSSLLNGALKVNPFAPASVADALAKALSLGSREMEYRRQRDLPFISSHPSSQWTRRILTDLHQLTCGIGRGRGGLSRRVAQPLPLPSVMAAYQNNQQSHLIPSASRVFIFDYGGVLLQKEKFDIYIKTTLSAIAGRRPSDRMMETLRRLSEDPRNVVVIITGLTRQKLSDTFKGFRNVTLATSNGLVYSWAENLTVQHKCLELIQTNSPSTSSITTRASHLSLSSTNNVNGGATGASATSGPVQAALTDSLEERNWECMPCNVNWTAVAALAMPIITRFTFRTNGTCQTPRFPGIGWSYFGADPEWGQKQATQLTLELEAALVKHDVKVTSLIPGSIEVVPRTLHKGQIVRSVLEKVLTVRAGKLPGLVTLFSGEESDDGMTNAVYRFFGDAPQVAQSELRHLKVFTATVGKREAASQYYLNDVTDVENLLAGLVASDSAED